MKIGQIFVMTIIEKNNEFYTIVLHLDVSSESQQEQLDDLIEFFESVESKQPGLVSTNFHKSCIFFGHWHNDLYEPVLLHDIYDRFLCT